nr:MAG TPA_asm: hypothetical protein [Bacteriophage sp.]
MLTATQKEYNKISSLLAAYFIFCLLSRKNCVFIFNFKPFYFQINVIICLYFSVFSAFFENF